MKTLFTKFAKKPVAVILAVLMIVGSVSVAVYAEDYPEVNATITAKWLVHDEATNTYVDAIEDKTPDTEHGENQSINVEYAKPGDSVRADIYFQSDTPVDNITLIYAFDEDLLEVDWTKFEASGSVYKLIGYGGYVGTAAPAKSTLADYYQANSSLMPADANFDGLDAISIAGYCGQFKDYTNPTLITSIYLTVKSADTVKPDSGPAFVTVPEYSYFTSTLSDEGYNFSHSISIYDPVWEEEVDSAFIDLTLTNDSQALLFGGDINFDAVSNTYGTIGTGTQATVNGYVGDTLKGTEIPAVTPASAQYQLIGWSTAKKDGNQTDSDGNPVFGGDYSKMVIDAEDIQDEYTALTYKAAEPDTLYAVYGTADVPYEVRVYTQVLDQYGQPTNDYEAYPDSDSNTHTANGKYGATVDLDDVDEAWIPSDDHFTLNTDNSKVSAELVGNADQDYLALYYDRNAYTITWKIDDEVIDSADIYYGADAGVANYPNPDPVAYTDPADPNFGYKIDDSAWSNHEMECTDDITVTGALIPLDVNVIYHNTDASGNAGTFESGNATFTAAKKYGDSIGSADFTDTLNPPEGYHFAENAVTYKAADGTDAEVTDLGALPALTAADYDCSTIDSDTIIIDVYPNFEIDHGEITFDGNGGKVGGSDKYTEEYDYGQTITVPSDSDITPKSETDDSGVASNYTFKGWGESTDATANQAVTPDATYSTDKTYYAIWEDERITITYIGSEGETVLTEKRNLEGAPASYTIKESDYPDYPATPETGKTWVWEPASDENTSITDDFTVVGHYEYDLIYSVTDKDGNTSTSSPVQLKENDNLPGYAVDQVTGTTFKGWYSDPEFSTLFVEAGSETSAVMPASPLTLYGKYELNKHTITYMVDNAQDGEVETYKYGDPITIRTEPTKDGYTFSGWDKTLDPTMPDEDIVVSGTFTANDYTIVYMNGNEIVKVITQAYDTEIDPALEPDGSALDTAEEKFDSWSQALPERMPICTETVTGTEGGVDAEYPNAMKIEAQFVPQEYTLTYKVDGEQDGQQETYKVGDPITMRAEPTKDGYTFSGWSDTLTVMPASDVTIEGTFTANTYNIVYMNGDDVVKVITQAYDTDIAATEEPDGSTLTTLEKTFTGWSQSLPAKMPICTDTVAGYENALRIDALFDDNAQVTVTYVHADGTEDKLTGYPGADLTPAAFKDSDYTDGYDIAWDQDLTTFPGADTTVNLKKTAKVVSVTIDPANGDPTTTTNVSYDGTITEPDQPTSPDGADFDGWVTSDGTPFDFSKPIEDQVDYGTGELSIKARYSVTDNYYIVSGVNGEEFTYELMEGYKHYTDVADETYTVPAIPEMEGFTAKFWSIDKTTDAAPDGTWSTSSRDFYALYDINKHTITYMVDGTEYKKFEEVPFASEVKRPDADPTKEGFVFAGWKDADGKAPGNYESMPDKDLTFTAEWVVPGADYTITYYDREGSVYRVFTVHSGDPITADYIPEDPTRFAYVFKGWDPEIPDVMPEENLEINAVWELDPKFVAMVVGGVVVSGAVVGTVAAGNAALITGGIIVGGVALVVGGAILAEHTHKVTYIVDGETYRVYYLVEGTKVIVPKAPTKDGAEFTGWTPEVPDRMPANDLCFNATWSTDAASDNAAPIDNDIPDTGSATAGLSAFAIIATAAAAAYIIKRKKEDD